MTLTWQPFTRWSMLGLGAMAVVLAVVDGAMASSHREAPFVAANPKGDATDFYVFRSYELGRADYVTFIANHQPFQDPFGGPTFYAMDPDVSYEIHIDNDGDAREDLTFRFLFENGLADGPGLTLNVGGQLVAVPLINIGPVSTSDTSPLNLIETYSVQVIGDRQEVLGNLTNANGGAAEFRKPADNIGTKTFPGGYETYAAAHVYGVNIPQCGQLGRLFVGQRRESFAVNLGMLFDLFNAPAAVVLGGSTRDGRNLVPGSLAGKNITSIALELPIACIKGADDVIGAWTSAKVRQTRRIEPLPTFDEPTEEHGPWRQLSRLSAPLFNSLLVGLKDKNLFNGSQPAHDDQFFDYVTNPTLPELLEILFGDAGVLAPNQFPRTDLVAVFLTGLDGMNTTGSMAEMMRLNTSIPPTPKGLQNSLGALGCFVNGVLTPGNAGCDLSGFPNGRRPGDDAVDIVLRLAIGYLLPVAAGPSGQLPVTDASLQEDSQFDAAFPYLRSPHPGAP